MKHISEIVRAYIDAEKPILGLLALAICCIMIAVVAIAALGPSLRWGDVVSRILP